MIKGIWTALWSPTDQNGALMKNALISHLDFLLNQGVNGIVVCGSTGQFPYLDLSLRKQLIDTVVNHIGPKRTIVNISDVNPQVVINLAQFVSKINVAAIMLMPPSYYPFAQHDLVHYFLHMSKLATHPLILYNYPECVRNQIELETIEDLCKTMPIAGIKQSGADFNYHVPLVNLGLKHGFGVYTGSDTRLPQAVKMGVAGSIGGLSNAIPELIVEVYSQSLKKNDAENCEAQKKIQCINKLLKNVCFPLNIAALMESRNLIPGHIKEVISEKTRRDYSELVAQLRLLSK